MIPESSKRTVAVVRTDLDVAMRMTGTNLFPLIGRLEALSDDPLPDRKSVV